MLSWLLPSLELHGNKLEGGSGDMTVWNQNSLPLSRCEMVFVVNKAEVTKHLKRLGNLL